jgi:hypothetical protein
MTGAVIAAKARIAGHVEAGRGCPRCAGGRDHRQPFCIGMHRSP